MRLGIMGGTFDPIHFGHLFMAQEAAEYADLDRVLFVPSGTPPHKHDPRMASNIDRYEMTCLAVSDDPLFDVSRVETDRQGRSYTVETLKLLHDIYPHDDLFFIMGDDSALDIVNWREPFEIARIATLLSVGRPGASREKIAYLPAEIRGALRLVDAPKLELSSTDIRERITSGRSVRYMLPDSVIRYIYEHDLYKDR